jgi:hypothetical protein
MAITDISVHLLQALLRRIEQLQGCFNELTTFIVATLALAAVAPAPSAKRTRDQDVDDAARNTRPRTEIPQTVALPTTFVYTLSPLGPSPIAVSALPIATTTLLPATTAPPAVPPTPPHAPSAPAAPNAPPRASAPGPLAPPAAPAAPPLAHAIPQRQAAPQVDPALQVVFGPSPGTVTAKTALTSGRT